MTAKVRRPGRQYKIRGFATKAKIKKHFPKGGMRTRTKPGTKWVKSPVEKKKEL